MTKTCIFSPKKTLKLPLAVNLNRKSAIKFEKKQSTKRNLQKASLKKQANFN